MRYSDELQKTINLTMRAIYDIAQYCSEYLEKEQKTHDGVSRETYKLDTMQDSNNMSKLPALPYDNSNVILVNEPLINININININKEKKNNSLNLKSIIDMGKSCIDID